MPVPIVRCPVEREARHEVLNAYENAYKKKGRHRAGRRGQGRGQNWNDGDTVDELTVVEDMAKDKGARYKTRLCIHYNSGCARGDNCLYAHGEHELRDAAVAQLTNTGVFNTRVDRRYCYVSGVPYTESQWCSLGYSKSGWEMAKRCRMRIDPETGEKQSIDVFVNTYGGTLWEPPVQWKQAFEPKRDKGGQSGCFSPFVAWAYKNGLSEMVVFLRNKGFRDSDELGTLSRADVDALFADSSFEQGTKARFLLAIRPLQKKFDDGFF